MEFITDKLKLINYEKAFCQKKRPPWTPLSRSYFAVPSPNNNQNEQFFYFTSLVSWLFTLAGRKFNPPAQFDDPNSSCTNILMELKNMGFATPSFPPSKLIKGHGDAVCNLLDAVVDLVLEKQGWRWQKAVYQPDGYVEDAEVDNTDINTDQQEDQLGMATGTAQEPEEEEAYMDGRNEFPKEGKEAKEEEDAKPLHSQVDSAEWKLELERVGPQLRVTVLPDQGLARASGADTPAPGDHHQGAAGEQVAARQGGGGGGVGAGKDRLEGKVCQHTTGAPHQRLPHVP